MSRRLLSVRLLWYRIDGDENRAVLNIEKLGPGAGRDRAFGPAFRGALGYAIE